jgi:hypothetical protein
VISADMAVGQAPMPPSAASCATQTMEVVSVQISQEKKCGFTRPARMAAT